METEGKTSLGTKILRMWRNHSKIWQEMLKVKSYKD